MLYIRVVKTASDSQAVQIVYYRNRKRIIFKHIGSGRTDEDIASLKIIAQDIIDNFSPTLPFFEEIKFNNLLHLDKSEFLGIHYTLFYEIIYSLFSKIGLSKIKSQLLLDLVTIRIKTDNGYLICSYSSVRYRKDKYEMEKQIEKAKFIIQNPSKNKKLKFTKANGQNIELNQKLIEKTKMLLGIKGYYTNLEECIIDNQTIIERYHELYRIEQAFRVSKHDLQTRPIFHYKEQPIKLHLLICLMALVVAKHIELQTNISIKKFVTESKKITDARLLNTFTGKEIKIRTRIPKKFNKIIKKLKLSH